MFIILLCLNSIMDVSENTIEISMIAIIIIFHIHVSVLNILQFHP